jgi:GWxTD domain-containing protein
MWLSRDHSFFLSLRLIRLESRGGKKLKAVFAAPFRFIFLLGLLLLSHFGLTPENAGAQIAAVAAPPAHAVDFDQTFGMPPYVFRTYHFAAAERGKVRVEVRLGMVNDILQFVKMAPDTGGADAPVAEKQGYRAQYEVNVTIWDKQKNPVVSRNWKRELIVKSFEATNDRRKFNFERATFDLPPGEYEIALEITDRDTGKNLRDRRPLKLNRLDEADSLSSANQDKAGLRLSSIVFTKPASPEMAAQRDSLLQNLAPIFLAKSSHRSGAAYFEIYGAQPGETLQLQYQLLDWRRQPLQEWQETLIVGQTPLGHLVDLTGKITQAGLHTFRLVAQSRSSFNNIQKESREAGTKPKEAEAEESFQVQISAEQNYLALLAENKNLPYEPLRYIVKSGEYKRLLETADSARDSLVNAFWRERDPDPATAANQLREEFYRRVAFAEMRFASANSGKAGWESDRGRIYIKYGPPREVHHQLAEQGAPPYEIWLYPDLDLHFVFRDKTGSGDFELVNR